MRWLSFSEEAGKPAHYFIQACDGSWYFSTMFINQGHCALEDIQVTAESWFYMTRTLWKRPLIRPVNMYELRQAEGAKERRRARQWNWFTEK